MMYGDRVCEVRMDGCMAHVRGPERFGKVMALHHGPDKADRVLIKWDDGQEELYLETEFRWTIGPVWERQI